jgi:hypothetical protein
MSNALSGDNRMIIDCTMFHWEFDLLELRIRELWDVVDYFVVTESVCDHRGNPRELLLSNNIDKFEWASEKLIINISERLESAKTTWDHEKYQRLRSVQDAIRLTNAGSEDFILISDVDEIFRAQAVKELSKIGGRYVIHMPMYYYYLNLFVHDWYHPRALSVKYLTDPNEIRTGSAEGFQLIMNAGWHFSYLGDERQIQYKLKTFAHDEMDTELFTNLDHIRNSINTKTDLFDRFGNAKFQLQYLNDFWPSYVLENKEKYNKYILR